MDEVIVFPVNEPVTRWDHHICPECGADGLEWDSGDLTYFARSYCHECENDILFLTEEVIEKAAALVNQSSKLPARPCCVVRKETPEEVNHECFQESRTKAG